MKLDCLNLREKHYRVLITFRPNLTKKQKDSIMTLKKKILKLQSKLINRFHQTNSKPGLRIRNLTYKQKKRKLKMMMTLHPILKLKIRNKELLLHLRRNQSNIYLVFSCLMKKVEISFVYISMEMLKILDLRSICCISLDREWRCMCLPQNIQDMDCIKHLNQVKSKSNRTQ